MKNLTEYIKGNSISIFNENKKEFDAEYGQVVYDKLVNGIKLTDEDKDFTKNAVSVFPVDEQQLRLLIIKLKEKKISLNWLDVSGVGHMYKMFFDSKFNGDISKWDVSNVRNMSLMFYKSKFNGDISKWDVSSVETMCGMFTGAKFNGDISKWDVSSVTDMNSMFKVSQFNGDISKWDVSSVKDMRVMFQYAEFNRDISKWDVSNVDDMDYMFYGCPIKDEYKPKK